MTWCTEVAVPRVWFSLIVITNGNIGTGFANAGTVRSFDLRIHPHFGVQRVTPSTSFSELKPVIARSLSLVVRLY